MDKKTTGIIGYLTIIGWLIAFLAGDKEGAKFHLNQSLVIILFSLVAGMILPFIPIIGWLLSIVVNVAQWVFIILGIISAAKDEEKELPFIGAIKILK